MRRSPSIAPLSTAECARWARVKELFAAALERPSAERAAFVASAAGADDDAVRAEVLSLLASHERADGDAFLEQPPSAPTFVPEHAEPAAMGAPTRPDADAPGDEQLGRRIGPYRLVRRLGEGGMGAVFLAERDDAQYDKRVAIKLVKRGMDTDFILRRFLAERQILASLDHPGIARFLDGGTTDDGLPYFVMEYILGEEIDLWCDARKLSVPARLRLFLSVCAAVQYAHQNLVVHRDLKPGNILVTAAGEVRLLDFGIAKLLDPTSFARTVDATLAGMRLLTPEYASPEQLLGEPITTASDVYALGALLYELLTGRRPRRVTSRGLSELRALAQIEPQRPSTAVTRPPPDDDGPALRLRTAASPQLAASQRASQPRRLQRALRGDLDNIVLMAMRREPQRRYASAAELAQDVLRHLDGRPVRARRDTFAYRAGKFVRRNKLGVAAAALLFATLTGGIVATSFYARDAQRSRARAERRFDDVRRLANSLVFELHDAIAPLAGSTPARALLVRRALDYLDALAADRQEDAHDDALLLELATAYRKIGDVQGNPINAHLGDAQGALASYGKAMEHLDAHLRRAPHSREGRMERARLLDHRADVLFDVSDFEGALTHSQEALAGFQALLREAPGDRELRREIANVHLDLADTFTALKRAGAVAELQAGRALHEALVREDPTDRKARRTLSVALNKMGDAQARESAFAAALGSYQGGLVLREALAASAPGDAAAMRDLSTSLGRVGNMLRKLGRVDEALSLYERGLAMDAQVARLDPLNAQALRDVGVSHARIGETQELLATRQGAAVAAQVSAWEKARAAFVRCAETFAALSKGPLSRAYDAQTRAELPAAIARCDAALRKLRGKGASPAHVPALP